jgi:hypothetical protein
MPQPLQLNSPPNTLICSNNTLFSGFYQLSKVRAFDSAFGFNLYLLAGLLFCISVDYEQKF